MLEISLASSEAFLFACFNSPKGNCCKFSTNAPEILLLLLKLFFACSFFSRKAASLVQMLEISLASSEAFLFACFNSLKGTCCKLSTIVPEILLLLLKLFLLALSSQGKLLKFSTNVGDFSCFSEAFFACFNSPKGTCCKLSTNVPEILWLLLKLFLLALSSQGKLLKFSTNVEDFSCFF
ncbi:hypothetical protein CY35_15G049000 [Sphagnum magellanicum]|nr:hypothetical protein CY35_15G049000 [Sphagnum magellanicum]